MSHVQSKPITNWCPQAKPDEQGQCGTDKLAEDGKRHHCDKTPGHADPIVALVTFAAIAVTATSAAA